MQKETGQKSKALCSSKKKECKTMKKTTLVFLMTAFSLLWSHFVHATPSTTYWTPCVMDIQGYKLWHITYDTYVPLQKTPNADAAAGKEVTFPVDLGLTVGVLNSQKLQMEVGFDLLEPFDNYPLFFNAKVGYPENTLSKNAPALQVGIFNVGTKKDVTNYNIAHFMVGKTFPSIGRLTASYYVGNSKLLVSSAGKKENTGFMVAWDRWIVTDKVLLAGDYASGKNALGAGGLGVYFYFTKNIDLLVGPVWFNDEKINGRWKWTTQLDINFK